MKLLYAVAALLIGAGPAWSSGACLMRDQIDGWGARDAHTLVVNDRFGKKYLLTVTGWCQDIEYGFGMSFRGPIGSTSHTCLERGDTVVPHGGGASPALGARCTITGIEPYTPEMEKAYRDAKAAKAGAAGDKDAADPAPAASAKP